MLKRILSGSLVLSLFALSTHADPASDVKDAAKKLADSANYSWSTNVTGGQRASSQTGKAEKDGFSSLSITMGDNTIEALMKGDEAAIKVADGWKTLAEASSADVGQPNPGRFIARAVKTFKSPAAQADDLAGKAKDLAKAEDAIAGTLPEATVKELMAFGGRRGGANANANATPPEISGAKGTVKFWIKDGVLSKMEVNVQGSMSFNGQDRDINRTTTVEIKDVGTTKVEVPAEGKAKMATTK